MAISVFKSAGYGISKVYLGNEIWRRNSVYEINQNVNLNVPKGAIGLICTCSNNTYYGGFGNPSVGNVLISESRTGTCEGKSTYVLLFKEPLKSNATVPFYYASQSGCTYVMYPIMLE